MRLAASIVLAGGLLAGRLSAVVQNVDCRNPHVFPGANVNAVILPYQYVGTHERAERSLVAQKLGLIVQREVLQSMLVYHSIAAVQLMQSANAPPCDANLIARQLLGKERGAASTVRPGAGLVLLSGVLYEEGQDLFIRSFVRMYQNTPTGNEIVMKVGSFSLTAGSTVDGVAFPPVHLSASDILAIEKIFRASSLVRKERDLSTPGEEIPFDPRFPFAYRIMEVSGPWTRIEPLSDGPSGWMHDATPSQGGTNLLRQKMLELRFMVTAVGYLQAAMAEKANDTSAARQASGAARANLDELMKQSTSLEQSPETLAAIHALSAQVRLQEGRAVTHWRLAVQDLDKAIVKTPSDARIKNFTAICRAWLLYHEGAASKYKPAEIAADLRDAAARSSDIRILENLSRVYQAMLSVDRFRSPGIGDEAIRSEIEKIGKILTAAKSN